MFGRSDKSQNEADQRVSQAELQDALLRFQGRLSAHITEAFARFATSDDAEVRLRALRDHLVYQATALDIATGPMPEANVLDMVTFVDLAVEACRSRWSSDVHGERGAGVESAFQAASADAWRVARLLLTPEEEGQLRKVIHDWQEENPEISRYAAVRLPGFSRITAEGASKAEAEASGLFSSVRQGVQAADMARLLGERVLFAIQRMPFFARLQVTVALGEASQELGADLPGRAAAAAGAAADRVERNVNRIIVTGALAAAGVVVVAAVAYAVVR